VDSKYKFSFSKLSCVFSFFLLFLYPATIILGSQQNPKQISNQVSEAGEENYTGPVDVQKSTSKETAEKSGAEKQSLEQGITPTASSQRNEKSADSNSKNPAAVAESAQESHSESAKNADEKKEGGEADHARSGSEEGSQRGAEQGSQGRSEQGSEAGSGYVWFGIVFVILLVSVFAFT
jgi:cobalamin biosynthesis Mg chelatase CobN